MSPSLASRFVLGLGLIASILACGGKAKPSHPMPVTNSPPPGVSDERERELIAETEALRESLSAYEAENTDLRGSLTQRTQDLTSLEEQNATLELELAIALEELIRSQSNVKNVQSRAFAVSRIAEVRVELESFGGRKDSTLRDRLERAESFLERADQALKENNVGGAAYLAVRAGELVRQARTVSEIRRRESIDIVPIVPPRPIEVQKTANLRRGPSIQTDRVGLVEIGTKLEAVGRLGEWYQVRSSEGRIVWIHGSLVE
ncbi:MAG TPA: SH3 domain-containing protein [Vicinamibacteria bacterium]|nr:SH3 domain-containing protein [Vicinamibacteria bacterium]